MLGSQKKTQESIVYSFSQSTQEEVPFLFNELLKNKNLLRVNDPTNLLTESQKIKLELVIKANRDKLLNDCPILVEYTIIDSDKKKSIKHFKFDDQAFYKAEVISFSYFTLDYNNNDNDLKLALLKDFILEELEECRYLKRCTFNNFLNNDQKEKLQVIIDRNKTKNAKYQFNWPLWTGIVFGVIGLSTLAPLGLLKALVLFMGGAGVGSAIAGIRERFLFKMGYPHLQKIKRGEPIDDPLKKECLLAGLESKHWKGYFRSFKNPKTYSKEGYRAYVAGLYIGVHRRKQEKEAIKSNIRV